MSDGPICTEFLFFNTKLYRWEYGYWAKFRYVWTQLNQWLFFSDGHVEHHHTVDKAVSYNVGAIVGLCVGILLVVVVIAAIVAGLKGYLQSPAKYYVKFVSYLIICLLRIRKLWERNVFSLVSLFVRLLTRGSQCDHTFKLVHLGPYPIPTPALPYGYLLISGQFSFDWKVLFLSVPSLALVRNLAIQSSSTQ